MTSNRSKLLLAVGAVGVGVSLAAGYYYAVLQRKKRDETDEGIGDEDSIISDSDEPPVVLKNLATPVTVAPKEQNANEFQFPAQNVEDIFEEDEVTENHLDSQKKVLILGLDGAGKTALIETLTKHQNRNPEQYSPTSGFNVAQSIHGDFCLNLMEVGGGKITRPYWPNFLQKTNLLVYVVDASDQSRLVEAKDALFEILQSEELKEIPCLFLANKQDVKGAASCDDIISGDDLARISSNKHLKFTLLDCVCIPDSGETDYAETLKDVISNLLQ